MTTLKISRKVPLVLVTLALLSATVTGVMAYRRSSAELVSAAEGKLLALVQGRGEELHRYLEGIRQDISIMSGVKTIGDALIEFHYGYGAIPGGTETLRELYIAGNPNPAGSKHKLDTAADGSDYSDIHSRYHPWMRRFIETRGYYDIFLIDPAGDVVYTTFKEPDFATRLTDPQWKDGDLATLFQRIAAKPQAGDVFFSDFRPYAASNDAPASFIAAPVFDEQKEFLGVLAFQMPIDRINAVMQAAIGLGETGETYIVGGDKLMRSQSRLEKEATILKKRVDTQPVTLAQQGKTGVMEAQDYHGADVVAAYAPLTFMGASWSVIAETDLDEILAPVRDMRNFMLIVGVIVLAGVTAVGAFVARGITRPIDSMTDAMQRLAGGDKTVEIPALGRSDEIGEMAKAVQVFKDNALAVERLQAEQERAKQQAEADRRAAMHKMADEFEADVKDVVEGVASASTEMQATADAMAHTARETSEQSVIVAAAAEQASSNVETVAAAAEELSASISEISRQVAQSATVSRSAVEEAQRADAMVQGLATAATRIGEVVSLINDIASQTNLLALNATIEAARAGEAGKGFAVVAGEVKNLANQTAKATEEIGSQIGAVQGATQDAVKAIQGIGGTIEQISEIASAIASAVEEQGAATQEIARNVQQASTGTREVSGTIGKVTQAAGETGQAAGQVLEAAGDLSRQSERLKSQVTRFLATVRAG